MSGETDAIEFAGVPDAFQRLWSPYRMAYIQGENKPADDSSGACPFCRIPDESDEDGLVVRRGELCYVVMNLYPYNSGHLLVCPYRHLSDLTELTAAEAAELTLLSQEAMTTLRAVSHPAGFNLGLNQGEVAGAGIAAHLHQHVVPRWQGDANFLPIIGRSRALPQLLGDARQQLADGWVTTGGNR
ncbi:HIT family protein [Aestuariimicrobium soli]|uniref:HIT family protein n=1 Tax=Aestuariimicrobium soli TaxID=2035834 RepID=UPI003EB87C2E